MIDAQIVLTGFFLPFTPYWRFIIRYFSPHFPIKMGKLLRNNMAAVGTGSLSQIIKLVCLSSNCLLD